MVKVNSSFYVKGGMPLGGIGAGKIEITPRGELVNFNLGNNWSKPIRKLEAFHILVKPEKGEPFLLQDPVTPFYYLPNLSTPLEGDMKYPIANLIAKRGDVEARVTYFSALIPEDVDDSSLPAVGIYVRTNAKATLALSFPNVMGINASGRVNRRVKDGFSSINARANPYDHLAGETYVISNDPKRVITQYNANGGREREKTLRPGKFFENEDVWKAFLSGEEIKEEAGESMGSYYLPAGMIITEGEAKFVISWYMRHPSTEFPYRHYYTNLFESAIEVGRYFLDNFDEFLRRTIKWQDSLIDPSLPDWLKDAIINSTYVLTSSAWLDEKGRFSLLEAPEVGPMVGTVGGFAYETGTLPIVLLFPKLEEKFLRELAKSIRDDGYIPHDLGTFSFDSPSDGTTAPPKWKDTNPTFTLLVLRYFKITNDMDFLREMYPYLKRAMDWFLSQDKDADGLPELEGSCDTGYDCVPMKGWSSYTSTLAITSYLAQREVASVLHDAGEVERMNEVLQKSRKSLLSTFDGKKFKAWKYSPESFVFAAQLTGSWWSFLLGLEEVVSEDVIKVILRTVREYNGKASPYCTPNMVTEDGSEVDIDSQLTSSWPRLVFSISSLGYRRESHEWQNIAKKEWDNLVREGLIWNFPSIIHGWDGKPDNPFLDHYIGSPALWSFTYHYSMRASKK
ncbi:hypothetical protein HS7_14630 [Sulfolobales archaeon HS-7]|nr:hypothetical protein HS7_14630 [Sulfolobales archaeon HS-7]